MPGPGRSNDGRRTFRQTGRPHAGVYWRWQQRGPVADGGLRRLGVRFRIASPPGYELEDSLVDRIMRQCPTLDFGKTSDPVEAVRSADIVYTDTWVSMGQEEEKNQRLPIFKPYQINQELLPHAPKAAIVMHCLPAYRGVEITDEVIDGPQSVVFEEAENRLHFQKGLLAVLLGGM